jgi:hypothetical protein
MSCIKIPKTQNAFQQKFVDPGIRYNENYSESRLYRFSAARHFTQIAAEGKTGMEFASSHVIKLLSNRSISGGQMARGFPFCAAARKGGQNLSGSIGKILGGSWTARQSTLSSSAIASIKAPWLLLKELKV